MRRSLSVALLLGSAAALGFATGAFAQGVVKVDAWIVGDGTSWARTDDEVHGLFEGANRVFSQVGVHLDLASVNHVTNQTWMVFNPEDQNWEIPYRIESFANGTGGLVCFFVHDLIGYFGIHHAETIIVDSSASFKTVAHETGHVFGLCDLFTWNRNAPTNLPPDVRPCRAFLPGDWGSDTEESYYPAALTQSNLVERLLMFGAGDSDDSGTDLPFGDIHALWFEWTVDPQTGSKTQSWHLSLAPASFLQHATNPFAAP